MAKEYFKKNNIEYQELDVAEDEKAREEMIKKSHQFGVPVIEINDQVFVGFNRLEIDKAIKGLV